MRKLITMLLTAAMSLAMVVTPVAYAEESEMPDEGYIEAEAPIFEDDSTIRLATDAVSMKDGIYIDWIDRLMENEYARSIYEGSIEGSDNDGENDWLIDPTILPVKQGYYVYEVGKFTGTAASKDAIYSTIQAESKLVSAWVRAGYDAFNRDYSEVFWPNGSSNYTWTASYNTDSAGVVNWTATYWFIIASQDGTSYEGRIKGYTDPDTIRAAITAQEGYIDAILADMPQTGTVDQIRYFYTWLTKNNGYNLSLRNGQSIPDMAYRAYSALEGNFNLDGPVCEGYARAFKILCDRVGIPNVLVNGKDPTTGAAHMWNFVQVDGKWYGCDVTYDDKIYNMTEDREGTLNYFLVGSDTVVDGYAFSATHNITNVVSNGGAAFTNGPSIEAATYGGDRTEFTASTKVNAYVYDDAVPTITITPLDDSTEDDIVSNVVNLDSESGAKKSFKAELTAKPGKYKQRFYIDNKHIILIRTLTLKSDATSSDIDLLLYGDVNNNGAIQPSDAIQIQRNVNGLASLFDYATVGQKAAADTNRDGNITAADVVQITRYINGMSSSLG